MIKFTVPQLHNMLKLQEALNRRIDPEWRSNEFPWHRAAWIEAAELMDHLGWKWWKKQEPDLVQAQIEIVDIWHFSLSYALQSEGSNVEYVADKIRDDIALGSAPLANGWELHMAGDDHHKALLTTIEAFVTMCTGDGAVSPSVVLHIASKLELDAETMYRMYLAKNVLNIFRQDHGYKEGTYRKIWRGLEDNQVLAEWMKAEPTWGPDELLAELGRSYGDLPA